MKALEYLKKEREIKKHCADVTWGYYDKSIDEAIKELEKIVKEHSEDRLAELEKVILDYYLAKGYRVGVGGWHFIINISTSYKRKEIQIMFRQDESSNSETVFRTYKQSTKVMFNQAIEHFSIKDNNAK